jgi:hypothetical protein
MPRVVAILGRNLVEHDLDCPDCGAMMVLVEHRGKPIYRCARAKQTACQGTHGAKPDGSPMGVPAHWSVRAVRRKAHRVFDLLWNGPESRMSRGAAYRWLQGAMQMTESQAHISRFDAAQCERVLALVRADFGLEPEPVPGEGQDEFFEVTL